MDKAMYDRLKTVYAALQDDESRLIFEKRLLYSLTENRAYLNDMLHGLISQKSDFDMMYELLGWLKVRPRDKIIVFGAGFAGREIIEGLESYGIEVEAICDNNTALYGYASYGHTIIGIDTLKERYSGASVIVGSNNYGREIYEGLLSQGIREDCIFYRDREWWVGREKQYFDSTVLSPVSGEVFVDGGAFRGENTLDFISWCGGSYGAAYLVEPDGQNCEYVRSMLIENGIEKAHIINGGLWSGEGKLHFTGNSAADSHIEAEGENIVSAVTVDCLLAGKDVTYIKMDIEGCELEALRGAAQSIRKSKPRLAVCVYHKPEDIIEIPDYILRLNPDYKLYLRHYSYTFTETVLYAVL